jgi:uncharacterized oligopeptide transporter (OPT) family protein
MSRPTHSLEIPSPQGAHALEAAPSPSAAAPEFTLRAVLVALAVAAIIGSSFPLIVLKLGFGPNVSVVSAFFGYLALSFIAALTGTRTSRLENNLVQTAGTTAAQAGFMCVVLAAFDMLNANEALGFSLHLHPLQTFAWLSVSGWIGVLLAVPLRRHYIDEEDLPFPDGTAAGETILILEDVREAKSRTKALGVGMGLSGLLTWLQMGVPKAVQLVPGATFFGAGGQALNLGIGWSFLSYGSGLLVGLRVMVSMAIGLVLAWIVLPSHLLAAGAIDRIHFGEVVRWVMWPATGMLVAGGLASLAIKWRSIVRTFANLRMTSVGGRGEFPLRWVVGGVIALSVALCLLQKWSLGLPIWMSAVALAVSLPLMLVGTRVLGETNWAPVSAMANLVQGFFAVLAPGNISANMIASGMSGSVAANGEHLMQDYRAGQIVGSNYRYLTYLQLMAVPVGALAVSLVYPILRDRYGVVDRVLADGTVKAAELTSPISVKWAGFAELLSQGLHVLPKGSGWALLVGSVIGVLIALGEDRPRWKKFLPSPTAIGIGMLIPATYVIPMLLGGITQAVWAKARPAQEASFRVPLASGFIAGEAVVSVVLAILAAVVVTLGLEG